MAPLHLEPAGHQAEQETALQARIADLEARLLQQAEELESTYTLLGRERAIRLRAEEALATAGQLIDGLFEHAPLGLQIFDREGYSFRMNELNRRLLGVSSRDYGAGVLNALTDPRMVARGHADRFARAYAGEIVCVRMRHADFAVAGDGGPAGGRGGVLEQTLFPILDEGGAVTAVVACTLDRPALVSPASDAGPAARGEPLL